MYQPSPDCPHLAVNGEALTIHLSRLRKLGSYTPDKPDRRTSVDLGWEAWAFGLLAHLTFEGRYVHMARGDTGATIPSILRQRTQKGSPSESDTLVLRIDSKHLLSHIELLRAGGMKGHHEFGTIGRAAEQSTQNSRHVVDP